MAKLLFAPNASSSSVCDDNITNGVVCTPGCSLQWTRPRYNRITMYRLTDGRGSRPKMHSTRIRWLLLLLLLWLLCQRLNRPLCVMIIACLIFCLITVGTNGRGATNEARYCNDGPYGSPSNRLGAVFEIGLKKSRNLNYYLGLNTPRKSHDRVLFFPIRRGTVVIH